MAGRHRALGTIVLLWASPLLAQPIGTTFTYQGRLTDGGNPASGAYDLQLALFDAATGGAQVGPTLSRDEMSWGAVGRAQARHSPLFCRSWRVWLAANARCRSRREP